MSSFFFFPLLQIILHPAGPTFSPHLMSNIWYWDLHSSTHLIPLPRYFLFVTQKYLLLFFVVSIVLHVHLVSSGLCSWILVLVFPYRSSSSGYMYRIGRSMSSRKLMLIARYHAWHCLYPWNLPLLRCSTLLCFSLHLWLRLHLPLLSLLCIILCLSLRGHRYSFFHLTEKTTYPT